LKKYILYVLTVADQTDDECQTGPLVTEGGSSHGEYNQSIWSYRCKIWLCIPQGARRHDGL